MDFILPIDFQRERAVSAGAVERFDLHGNHDLRTEFLRLNEGASRKRLAGYAGRESEIVLDAGARACLPAIGTRIEHDDGEPFRGGIDRGCEARRAAADD